MTKWGEEKSTIQKREVIIHREDSSTGQTRDFCGSMACQLTQHEGSCILISSAAIILQLDEVAISFPSLKSLHELTQLLNIRRTWKTEKSLLWRKIFPFELNCRKPVLSIGTLNDILRWTCWSVVDPVENVLAAIEPERCRASIKPMKTHIEWILLLTSTFLLSCVTVLSLFIAF